MSNSVFVPKSGNNGVDGVFSATSPVHNAQSDANKIINDINALISNAGVKAQAGGKRRASRKGSKKASKKGSRKQKGGDLEGGAKRRGSRKASKTSKKVSKKVSKKASKQGSKKGSRRQRGGEVAEKKKRGMNPFMANMMAVKAHVKKDDSSVKDGAALSKVVSAMLKSAGSVNGAIELYKKQKASGEFMKNYNRANEEIAAKRASKKSA